VYNFIVLLNSDSTINNMLVIKSNNFFVSTDIQLFAFDDTFLKLTVLCGYGNRNFANIFGFKKFRLFFIISFK